MPWSWRRPWRRPSRPRTTPAWHVLPAEPVPEGAGYDVRSQWKELLVYAEGDRSFALDATWGGDVARVHVPDAATWDGVVPDWLVGRRAEVVERVRRHGGHEVVTTGTGYPEVVRGGHYPEQ